MDEELKKELLLKHKPMPSELIKKRRKELNSKRFPSELWFEKLLLEKNIRGYRRNECLLFRFFGDFVFKSKRIVVEIDGSSHEGKGEYDQSRDKLLSFFDYLVFRIPYNNYKVAREVLVKLENALDSRPNRPKIVTKFKKNKYKKAKKGVKGKSKKQKLKNIEKKARVAEQLKGYYALKDKLAEILKARKRAKKLANK